MWQTLEAKNWSGTAWEVKDLKLATEGRIHRIKYEEMKKKADDQVENVNGVKDKLMERRTSQLSEGQVNGVKDKAIE